MEVRALLDILHLAERLKDVPRHCTTAQGRTEDVAGHCWRTALMALFLQDEFPDADIDRVIRMCLIHDLGEAFTGDIPSFLKTSADEAHEDAVLSAWVDTLPPPYDAQLRELYAEMAAQQTLEARIYKVLDNMEAVLQHNESPLSTWESHEYELNVHYGTERAAFSPYLQQLRAALREDTLAKIAKESQK